MDDPDAGKDEMIGNPDTSYSGTASYSRYRFCSRLAGCAVITFLVLLPHLCGAAPATTPSQQYDDPISPGPEPPWAKSKWIACKLDQQLTAREADINKLRVKQGVTDSDVAEAIAKFRSDPSSAVALANAAYMELSQLESAFPYSLKHYFVIRNYYNGFRDLHSREYARIGFLLDSMFSCPDWPWVRDLGKRLLSDHPDDLGLILGFQRADATFPKTQKDRDLLLSYASRVESLRPKSTQAYFLYAVIYESLYYSSNSANDGQTTVSYLRKYADTLPVTSQERAWALAEIADINTMLRTNKR